MRAITFDISLPRLAAAKILGAVSPRAFVSSLALVRCQHVPDPNSWGDDWVLVEPRLAGVCGSDVMQVFIKAGLDNPLSAVVSGPHVMGHEVVGTVIEIGRREASDQRPTRRGFANAFLRPRGLPPCESCQNGDYPLCHRFFEGRLAKGMQLGTCSDVGGGFAEAMSVHESMLFPIPDGVGYEAARLVPAPKACRSSRRGRGALSLMRRFEWAS
jgi:L-iditol 2-dehydrogenase